MSEPVHPYFMFYASFAQSLLTSLALIVGGIWGWFKIQTLRTFKPRATVTQTLCIIPLDADHNIARLTARVVNCGEIMFPVFSHQVYLMQVLPIPDTVLKAIETTGEAAKAPTTEADWSLLGAASNHPADIEVEPGEWHEFHFDILIPTSVSRLMAYTYFANVAKNEQGIGWGTTTVHDTKRAA